MKCVACKKNFKFKRTSRQNRAHVLNEKELIVINRLKPCGSTDIRSVGDPVCNSCRRLIQRNDSHDSSTENDSTADEDFCMPAPAKRSARDKNCEYIEMDIPSCTFTEKFCIVCKRTDNRSRIPFLVRYNTYIKRNFYIPKSARCCKDHYLINSLYDDCFSKIPVLRFRTKIPVDDMKRLFEEVTRRTKRGHLLASLWDKSIIDSDLYSLTGLHKVQFFDLLSKLKSLRTSKNRSISEALAVFLMKMRTNLSHNTLATLLAVKNSQLIGHYCDEVESAFVKDIIPNYIGCKHISRDNLLLKQSVIAKSLFDESELILIADGTYAYHQKSKNNLYQRKSYSVQKNTNLCKPFTVCTTTGYIIDFFGPYLATVNDASIMKNILSEDNDFVSLLKPKDCFIVDRGFRDSISLMESMGFIGKMPCFKNKNEKQLTTKQSNESRVVTKVRWVVEAVHGIIKQKWKFLSSKIKNQSLLHIQTCFRIAGCLHNMYGKELVSDKNFEDEIIRLLKFNVNKPNKFTDFVNSQNFERKTSAFKNINESEIHDFPELTNDDLRLFTLGSYQIAQSISYISEHFEANDFPILVSKVERNIIFVKMQSRHISSKKYNVFIRYEPEGSGVDSILEWTCNCQNGLRTLGCCVHIASVVAYLSNLRFESREYHPAKKLNNLFKDGQPTINEDSDEE